MRRARLALLLAPLLLTAGCIGSAADAGEGPTRGSAAGAPEAPGGAGSETAGLAQAPPPPPRATPFGFEGNTGAAVCPVLPRGHCVALQAARIDPPEVGGPGATPLRMEATLAWEAASPASDTFYASLLVDMGDGWEWDPAREPGTTGQSPIEVAWDLSQYPPGSKFLFYVETSKGAVAGPVGAYVVAPQDFRVDGVYWSV